MPAATSDSRPVTINTPPTPRSNRLNSDWSFGLFDKGWHRAVARRRRDVRYQQNNGWDTYFLALAMSFFCGLIPSARIYYPRFLGLRKRHTPATVRRTGRQPICPEMVPLPR